MGWALNAMTGSVTEVPETGAANCMVDERIRTAAAFVARLITVFETLMAELGWKIWDLRTKDEDESAAKIIVSIMAVHEMP